MSPNQAALQGEFNIITVLSAPIIPMLLCKFKLLQCWLSINHNWVVRHAKHSPPKSKLPCLAQNFCAGISMQITTVLPGEQISFALSSPPQVTIHRGCGYQCPITRVWFSQLQDRDVYRLYPRRLESLTVCRWNYNHYGSTFYAVIRRP